MANTTISIPDVKTILTTGLQFGHSTSRWNPLMSKYIFTAKNGIHVIDVIQSRELLAKAVETLVQAAGQGDIIFVGTKRQASQIVLQQAIASGAHFVINRWPGGLLTNFKMAKKSFDRLLSLERMFEEGVEGRTKYEIAKMKVEWGRLNRLYGGVKHLQQKPAAVVVIDPRFEKVAVRECRKINVPVIALADTNCDPTMVDYIVPGNDDALRSIEMVVTLFADAVKAGNEGKGIQHDLKDYSTVEVKIIRKETEMEEKAEIEVEAGATPAPVERFKSAPAPTIKRGKGGAGKGILERVKEQAEKPATEKKVAKVKKEPATKKETAAKAKPAAKKAPKAKKAAK